MAAVPAHAVAIAIIGVTGSGKSSFINLASGSNLPVNQSHGGCTTTLESSTFSLDGRTVTLIDTPGFDETTPNVLHVLKLISEHIAELYHQGVEYAGVIYMHCTAEDRIGVGPSRENFYTFRKFCGDSGLRNILIVANKRSEEHHASDVNGKELGSADKDEFFGPAVDKGARMLSHDGSQASAHAIIRHLIDRESTAPRVQEHSSIRKTDHTSPSAGAGAVRQLSGQIKHHTKTFGELCQRIGTTTRAEEAKTSLEEIERIRGDLEYMVTNIATENLRLEDENRQYRHDFSTQMAESELRVRQLGEAHKARELAEAERCRAEAELAEERALRERENEERENRREHGGRRYGKLVTCGALAFALICVSRFVFDGSVSF